MAHKHNSTDVQKHPFITLFLTGKDAIVNQQSIVGIAKRPLLARVIIKPQHEIPAKTGQSLPI